MGRDRAAHDLFDPVLAEWKSWAAGTIHHLGDISGAGHPCWGQKGQQGFLESTLPSLPTCTVPILMEIQHIQPHRSPGCREISEWLQRKANICWETSSAPRPRQTSVFRAMRVRWGEHSALPDAAHGAEEFLAVIKSQRKSTESLVTVLETLPTPHQELCWVWEVLECSYLVWNSRQDLNLGCRNIPGAAARLRAVELMTLRECRAAGGEGSRAQKSLCFLLPASRAAHPELHKPHTG